MNMDEIKTAITADLFHELKKTKRALANTREDYIKAKRHMIELEAKQNALQDELDKRGE